MSAERWEDRDDFVDNSVEALQKEFRQHLYGDRCAEAQMKITVKTIERTAWDYIVKNRIPCNMRGYEFDLDLTGLVSSMRVVGRISEYTMDDGAMLSILPGSVLSLPLSPVDIDEPLRK